MYYLSKIIQALGLTLILIGFVKSFPNLMDRTLLVIGIGVFVLGWCIQRFMLK